MVAGRGGRGIGDTEASDVSRILVGGCGWASATVGALFILVRSLRDQGCAVRAALRERARCSCADGQFMRANGGHAADRSTTVQMKARAATMMILNGGALEAHPALLVVTDARRGDIFFFFFTLMICIELRLLRILRILRKLRKLRNIFGHDLSTESDMITDRTSRERERERDREMWME